MDSSMLNPKCVCGEKQHSHFSGGLLCSNLSFILWFGMADVEKAAFLSTTHIWLCHKYPTCSFITPYGQTKFYKTCLRSLLFQIRDGVTQIRNAGAGPQPQMTTVVYFNLEFPFQQPLASKHLFGETDYRLPWLCWLHYWYPYLCWEGTDPWGKTCCLV